MSSPNQASASPIHDFHDFYRSSRSRVPDRAYIPVKGAPARRPLGRRALDVGPLDGDGSHGTVPRAATRRRTLTPNPSPGGRGEVAALDRRRPGVAGGPPER